MKNDFVVKRIRGLMGRILSSYENIFRMSDLEDVNPEEEFQILGEDILLMRNIVLDSCNDMIRSLPNGLPEKPNHIRFPRESFPIFKHAELSFMNDDIPVVVLRGDFKLISEIRDKIGVGIVYNDNEYACYACSGLEETVNYLIPFLDKARLARIIIGNGDYQEWRNRVVRIYKGEE
jgi:hypothetical protein